MPTYRHIDESELLRFTQAVLEAAGAPAKNAAIVADNLVQAELHGLGSHGPSRLLAIYAQRLQAGGMNPNPAVRVVQQRGTGAVVDGDNGPGAVVGQFAMQLAIDLAREYGSGWVTVRNSSHYGAGFIFAREALPHGMIGFTSTNAVAQVAPHGGREKALGTNPICIAVPGGAQGNIILDMATTVVARGKVLLAAMEGKPIPLGWAIDAQGRPTTDPVAASGGVMLPLGGHKGFGLALMVEVFCALLSGAAMGPEIGPLYGDLDKPQSVGHFFGAMDISVFRPLDEFKAEMDEMVTAMKGVPLAEGFQEILMPGEPETRCAARFRAEGIPMAEDVIASLNEAAANLGVGPLVLRD